MRTFDEFVNAVKTDIIDRLPGNFQIGNIDVRELSKNNGVRLTGLTIMEKGNTVSPTIYLEPYYAEYENGRTYEEILSRIADVRMKEDVTGCHLDDFRDFEWAKEKILPELVSAGRNRDLLETAPHKPYGGDLAVIFKVVIDDPLLGKGRILIKNGHAALWDTDTETLWGNALENMRKNGYLFMDMAQVLTDSGMDLPDDAIPPDAEMYILTNRERTAGAALVTDTRILDEICSRLNDELLILPSSIHEVIIIPRKCKEDDISGLAEMVAQINAAVVSPDEVLSDSVYSYKKDSDGITKTA